MGILRKKKNEEGEELEEEGLRKKPRRRRAVEGRETRRRQGYGGRRKKPPKEWGKRERIAIFILILATAGTSGVLALTARNWKLPGFPRIRIPSIPNISFLSDETIVIEANKDNLIKKEQITKKFGELTDNLSGVYGLYVVHLADGYSFGVNENEIFEPASLNKLPVIFASYRQYEKGEINLDDKYTLKNIDKIKGSGILYSRENGSVYSYRELVELMGKQSDNTAYNIMRKMLGDKIINNTITEIGMRNTSPADNETTPKDIGIYFERLYKGGLISNESKDEILNSLTNTIYEDYLPAGVSDDIRVSHKYGREGHVINDAGIVFTDKPYVVVIMTKGIIETEAEEIIPDISRIVYEIEAE